MRTNLFNSFHFFNLLAFACQKTQAMPDIIFENASPNNTWVFNTEYSNNSFCEYDSCHLVLEPSAKQWIAFSQNNGVETIAYDICDTAGENAVIYNKGQPECAVYSGAKINVTATVSNVTATPVYGVQNIDVQKVQEKQTDSDATLSVYDINVALLNNAGSHVNIPKKELSAEQKFFALFLFVSISSVLSLYFCSFGNKKKNASLFDKTSCGLFPKIVNLPKEKQDALIKSLCV